MAAARYAITKCDCYPGADQLIYLISKSFYFLHASAKYRPATEQAVAAEEEYMPRDSSPTIQEFRVRTVRVPMTEPHQTASGVISESPLVLTDVITDGGIS